MRLKNFYTRISLFLIFIYIFPQVGISQVNTPTPTPCQDGNDNYVQFLSHAEGEPGGTTFIDSSQNGTEVGYFGNTTTSELIDKFGNSSILFVGDGAIFFSTSGKPQYQIGTKAFTYDFWVYVYEFSSDAAVFGAEAMNDFSNILLFGILNQEPRVIIVTAPNGSIAITGNIVINTGEWTHIALIGNGGADGNRAIRLFVNGSFDGEALIDYDYSSDGVFFGGLPYVGALMGFIDEIRFSVGIARWWDTLDVPECEYSVPTPTPTLTPTLTPTQFPAVSCSVGGDVEWVSEEYSSLGPALIIAQPTGTKANSLINIHSLIVTSDAATTVVLKTGDRTAFTLDFDAAGSIPVILDPDLPLCNTKGGLFFSQTGAANVWIGVGYSISP
jgi:hypothetical protein